MLTDRRTDVTKLIDAFGNFAKAPNKKQGGYTANTVCSHFNQLEAVKMVSNHAELNSYLLIFQPDNIVTWECCERAAIPTEYDDTNPWNPIELHVFCVAQECPIINPTHYTRYEVLSSGATKNVKSWHVIPCRLIKILLKIQRKLLVSFSRQGKKLLP